MSKDIDVENLRVVYEDRGRPFTALEDVSFHIGRGEFVSIVGSSGCGKTTLLSVLEGLRPPTSGTVSIDGVPVRGTGRERSVVFQQYSLFPWMTALKNVAFALEQADHPLPRRERLEQAASFLRKVGLEGFGHRFPKELSGGQQQRVAIARALAENGDVLLMDEPFGAIDARNRAMLQDLLLELWEGENTRDRKTVVFITHDMEEAILLSDRIIVMEANPGHIRAEFKVPFDRPRHRLDLLRSADYAQFRGILNDVFFEESNQEVRSA